MKHKRKVFVLLELWTDADMEELRSPEAWQDCWNISETSGIRVLQTQANVSQPVPEEDA